MAFLEGKTELHLSFSITGFQSPSSLFAVVVFAANIFSFDYSETSTLFNCLNHEMRLSVSEPGPKQSYSA